MSRWRSWMGLGLGTLMLPACISEPCEATATCPGSPAVAAGAGGQGGTAGAGGGDVGTGGSAGHGGAAEVCAPGTQEPCYEGPAGTEGVGACVGGQHTCSADGSGYGACEGQVLPLDETCATLADDDCDGDPNPTSGPCLCEPGTVASCYSGPAGTEDVGVCAGGTATCDASGTTYGECLGETLPGLESCDDELDNDCDGAACAATVWAAIFGGSDTDTPFAVAANATAVVVAGATKGAIDFGNGALVSAGNDDVVVAKLGADGASVWSVRYGDASAQSARGVALDAAGNVVVAGQWSGTLTIGATTLSGGGSTNAFVAKLSAAGTPLWVKALGASGFTTAAGVAVDGAGRVIVTGRFTGDLLCSPPPAVVCSSTQGQGDIFVVTYDSAGNQQWVKTFGDGADQGANAVAVDGSNNIYLTGEMGGTVDFGSSTVSAVSGTSLWVAKLDAAGNDAWSRAPSKSGVGIGQSIAVGPLGEVAVAGSVNGTIDLGAAGQKAATGTYDVFAGVWSTSGTLQWGKLFGAASGLSYGYGVAYLAAGDLALTGSISKAVNFGGGSLGGAGSTDAFLMTLQGSTGAYHWGKAFGDGTAQGGQAVAATPNGELLWLGLANGVTQVGGNALSSAGGADMLVGRFSP